MASATPLPTVRPIVVQTLWRTGGTYLCFMLRERNPVALFYEALHEDYSLHTREQYDGFAAQRAEVSRRHPTKDFHYLTDFPFLPGGGVVGHRADFAYDRFVLDPGAPAAELRSYVLGLIGQAALIGRRPLFKLCRGFLRQPWLRGLIDPVTVYLARRPPGMLASFGTYNRGAYFYSGFLRIAHKNRDNPVFAPLFAFLASLNREYTDASEATISSLELSQLFSAETQRDTALFYWALALAAHATPETLVIDASHMGDPALSGETAAALSRHTGLDVSFADATPLDPGKEMIMRFYRQPEFARLTAAAITEVAPHYDLGLLSPPLRRQFEALIGA